MDSICTNDKQVWRTIRKELEDIRITVARDRHGYGKTRGFEVTGFAGTGMVVDFGTPRWWWANLFRGGPIEERPYPY